MFLTAKDDLRVVNTEHIRYFSITGAGPWDVNGVLDDSTNTAVPLKTVTAFTSAAHAMQLLQQALASGSRSGTLGTF